MGEGSIQDANLRMAEPVDLSDYEAVALRFYTVTRNWASTYTVRVSGDGGDTWTEFPVLTNLTVNTNTTNPQLEVVNITNVAAGQSEVLVEFNFYAEWGWWWAIDDVSLVVPDDNDVSISKPRYASYDPATDVSWENLEYSVYHVTQVRPLHFSVTATNSGATEQTGVYLEVNITDGDAYSETLTSDPVNIGVASDDSLFISDYTPPVDTGTYTITYTLHQDQDDENPDDNMATRSFKISDTDFARDEEGVNFIINPGTGEYWAGPGFSLVSQENLYCIGAAISDQSGVGSFFSYELRNGDLEYMDETATVEVTENMFNAAGEENFTWLPVGPLPLFAGDNYVVQFHGFGEEEPALVGIGNNDAPDFSSYVMAVFDTQDCSAGCYTTSTFMVRMGLTEEFCLSIGAEEAEQVSIHNLYPNPSVGQTTLEYSLLEKSDVEVLVFDNMGRVVMHESKGTQPVGEYRFDYDFSDLASGVYTFSIKVGEKAINKKLVIK